MSVKVKIKILSEKNNEVAAQETILIIENE